ncbi:MAG: type II secretion system protein [Candidatus Omnitrophica bacterium]|nr:type II secretion system protein [Candidatus Omnitrophota bacterium]
MKKHSGVTLIELIVALGILVLIVSILYSVFNVSLRGWQKADNLLQVTTVARVALDQMSKEIASARIKSGSNSYYCLGFDKSAGSGWRTDSIGDEFYFIAPLKPGNIAGGSDLCEVGYWLDGNGTADISDDCLRRFYATDTRDNPGSLFDFDFSTPSGKSNSDEFVFNVTNLEFDYFDVNNNLFNIWDSRVTGSPPTKIKISISVAFGKGTASTNPDFISKEFSTVVSLPQ